MNYNLIIAAISIVIPYILTRYTIISNKDWYCNLLFENKYPLLNKILSFKLFHCTACQIFWSTLILLYIFTSYRLEEVLIVSFTSYLFKMNTIMQSER